MTTNGATKLIEVTDLQMHFPLRQGIILQKQVGAVRAVDGINFHVYFDDPYSPLNAPGSVESTTGVAGGTGSPGSTGSALAAGRPSATEVAPAASRPKAVRRRVTARVMGSLLWFGPRCSFPGHWGCLRPGRLSCY